MPSATSNLKPKHSWRFDAIGTKWSVETDQPLSVGIKDSILVRIEEFDKSYSRFRDDSIVSMISKEGGTYEFPADSIEMIAFYRDLYQLTDGSVSPLVGGMLEEAGYDKEYSLVPKKPAAVPEWDDVMTWDGKSVTVKQPVTLDFGAAGKGYMVDMVAELLERSGVDRYVVDASGDVRVKGYEQTIGLENPYDASMVIGTVTINNGSLCASASNRRRWDDWHHIVNPHTLRPVDDVVATWVIAPTTMVADGLATALFFVPITRIEDHVCIRLISDGSVERSPGFVGELYI